MHLKRRDIFLKIEHVKGYSPYAPILCSRHYGRDCMFNSGHESGRLSAQEILGASLDALVFHEYFDPAYSVPNTAKLAAADVNEPPWYRRRLPQLPSPRPSLWHRLRRRLAVRNRSSRWSPQR